MLFVLEVFQLESVVVYCYATSGLIQEVEDEQKINPSHTFTCYQMKQSRKYLVNH